MKSDTGSNSSKNATLLVAMATTFLTGFGASSVPVALPTIGKEFGMDAVALGWVITVYPLVAAALLLPFGRMADIHGRKRVLTLGVAIYTVASLVAPFSVSGLMLISCRFLQGIGAAMLFTTNVAILSSVYPPAERGKALGVYVASVYFGQSVGPSLGGVLTHAFGWRSVFLVNVPLGLTAMVCVFWKLRGEWADARGQEFDLRGSVMYGLSIVGIIYGFSILPAAAGMLSAVAGVLVGVAFIWWEARASSPILKISLFKGNTIFVFSNLAALINYSATYAVTFLLSLYLQYIKGFDAQTAGLILITTPVTQAVFSPLAGRFSDKVEPRTLASLGMALTAVGIGLLTFVSQTTEVTYVLGSLVFVGVGFALFSSPNMNAVMGSVDKASYGVASATLSAMRQIGFTLSMGIAVMIFALYIGRVQITPEYYPAFLVGVKTAFIVFSGLCFAGVFASLARGKLRA